MTAEQALKALFKEQEKKRVEKTPEALNLKQIVNFMYYANIDIVAEIFKEEEDVKLILEKAQRYREEHDNNELGWLYFILNLDNHRLNILAKYIPEYLPL